MKAALCLVAFVVGCFVTVLFNGDAEDQPEPKPPAAPVKLDNKPASLPIENKMEVKALSYGTTSNGEEVTKFVCTNRNGLVLEMIDYGATVISFQTPDKNGKLANITLSCNDMAGYEACGSYFGSTVGRFCNRIANGKFTIDGKQYTLATNNDPNHLHGGSIGFDKQIWKGTPVTSSDSVGVQFKLVSKDGDEGYPGNLAVTVDYILTDADELIVDFKAETDKPTHVNLTNHNYWNLTGNGSHDVLKHRVLIEADQYLPVDKTGIPNAGLVDVAGTAFDFTTYHEIGERIAKTPSEPTTGYDHCYALRSRPLDSSHLAKAATVKEPESGRVMEIWTSQPGIQFYSGNFLDGQPGSGGFDRHSAFCLETQHFPDSPNQKEFPPTLLEPGQVYHQKTIHRFSVEN